MWTCNTPNSPALHKVALIRSYQFPLSLLSHSGNTKRQKNKYPHRVFCCNFMQKSSRRAFSSNIYPSFFPNIYFYSFHSFLLFLVWKDKSWNNANTSYIIVHYASLSCLFLSNCLSCLHVPYIAVCMCILASVCVWFRYSCVLAMLTCSACVWDVRSLRIQFSF